jgi:hypothetical protein
MPFAISLPPVTAGDARIIYQRTNEPCYWYVDSDFLPNYGTIYLRQPPIHHY